MAKANMEKAEKCAVIFQKIEKLLAEWQDLNPEGKGGAFVELKYESGAKVQIQTRNHTAKSIKVC